MTTPLETTRQKRTETSPTEEAHRALARDHPLEESQKSYHTILEQQVTDAEDQLKRPATALLLSGLAAGLDIGFGPFSMAAAATLLKDVFPKPVIELLNANLYAVGFILVVFGRSALFTEHTTSAVQPVLARRASVGQLLRLWGIVLLANIAGGILFAAAASYIGPALEVIEPAAFHELARPLVDKPTGVMFVSAIGAGWVMGLLSWLISAGRETTSQIIFVWLTTLVIGLGKLHHSIAGTVEVTAAIFAGTAVTWADYGHFLLWAVLGNAVGGAFFVALLKFGSVRQSAK
jgi:formate/nitrite transporter FocA (FNT family)